MGFTSVFLSAISMVLYPTLRKSSEEDLMKRYNNFNSIVIVLVFILIIAFYPMSYIVQTWLPNYKPAIEIFFILSSVVTVVIHNYYKTLNRNKQFFIIGIINLLILITAIFLVHRFIKKLYIVNNRTIFVVRF